MKFTDELIEAYERHAHERAANFPEEFKRQERIEFLNFLNKEQRKTILEIGCGPGQDARFFQSQGFSVFAIDNAPTMVKLTKERGIPAQVLDCYELNQISETFDAVYTMNCLLHIPKKDIGRIFRLISSRLNGEGLMYLGQWGAEDFEGIWTQDKYEPKRFFSFFRAETLLKMVQYTFRLEYYRRIEVRKGLTFNSLIVRKR